MDANRNSRKPVAWAVRPRPIRSSIANPATRSEVRKTGRKRNARDEILPELLGCHFFG